MKYKIRYTLMTMVFCGILGWDLVYQYEKPEPVVAAHPTVKTITHLIAPRVEAKPKPKPTATSTATTTIEATSTLPIVTSTSTAPTSTSSKNKDDKNKKPIIKGRNYEIRL